MCLFFLLSISLISFFHYLCQYFVGDSIYSEHNYTKRETQNFGQLQIQHPCRIIESIQPKQPTLNVSFRQEKNTKESIENNNKNNSLVKAEPSIHNNVSTHRRTQNPHRMNYERVLCIFCKQAYTTNDGIVVCTKCMNKEYN